MKITNTIQTQITIWQKQIVWQDFSPILVGAMILILLKILGDEITFLQPLRVILGLAYVLFVPGYCLTTALFPRMNDLESVERLALGIGFSVASVSILALVLDWLHLGLYPWPILLGEFGMIVLFIGVTLWRRSQLPPDVIYTPGILRRLSWSSLPLSNRRLPYILMVSLVISGLAAWAFLTPTADQFVTEFYILGSDKLVTDYPYQVGHNDEVRVNVGVINREKSELQYHFEVWVTDNLNANRRKLVFRSDPFSLRPGEKYENSVSWHMPWAGEDQKVELLLFDGHNSAPARQLRMWINVRE